MVSSITYNNSFFFFFLYWFCCKTMWTHGLVFLISLNTFCYNIKNILSSLYSCPISAGNFERAGNTSRILYFNGFSYVSRSVLLHSGLSLHIIVIYFLELNQKCLNWVSLPFSLLYFYFCPSFYWNLFILIHLFFPVVSTMGRVVCIWSFVATTFDHFLGYFQNDSHKMNKQTQFVGLLR